MINGFEIETATLSDSELDAMRLIVPHLRVKVGETQAVTNQKISAGIERVHGIKLGGARVRKIINYIRLQGVIPRLVATSKGYYVEPDDFKLGEYIDSLEQRAGAIQAVANALKNQKHLKNESDLFSSNNK